MQAISFRASVRISAMACAIVLILATTACEKTAPPAPPPPVVDVMTVHPQDVAIHREWVGTLDGDVNATIRPQITGYLIKQNYREGEFVKQGQTLFEIDSRTFQVAVEQAKAARAQQQAAHATAAANLARVKPLAEKNALSRKDLDDAVGAELTARAALDQASAALETAKLNLGFTRITSPIDGVAGIAKAQIGDLLSPSSQTELTTVSKIDPIRVYVNISEQEYLRYVRVRMESKSEPPVLELILADGSNYPQPGTFILLDRQAGQTTGTFKLGATFPNPDGFLRPGLFGKVRATVGVQKNAMLVPQRAVTEVQGRYLIAVIGEGNKVDMRPIKPGERLGSNWVINEGLKAGDRIVVEGTQKARPGSVVNPRPFTPTDKEKAAMPPTAGSPDEAKPEESKPADKG